MLKKKFKVIVTSLSLIAIILCLFHSCSKEKTIKIGALLALTGEHASHGITEQRGMELALQEVNLEDGINGRPLEIIYADSKMETGTALAEYRRLVSLHDIPVILGVTGSGVALSLADIAEKDKVVLLSDIDTSPALTTQGGKYFFRVIPSDDYSSKVLSQWAVKKGWEKAALIYNSQNAWSAGCKKAIENAFPAAGGVLLKSLSVTDQTENFKSQISELKESNPEVYFVTLMGRQAGLFARQCAEKKVFGPFLGTDNLSQDEFVTNAGEIAEKAFFTMPAEEKSAARDSLRSKYEKRYGQTLEGIAINAYNSVKLSAYIIKSLIEEGTPINGDSFRAKLLSVRYQGIAGPIEFDEHGDLKEAIFQIFTYRGDNVMPLEE